MWPRFDTLQEGTGRRREWTVMQNLEPLTKEGRQRAQTARHNFQHELREAGQTMRYKEVVKTRASLLGIEDGVDGAPRETCWRRAPSPATSRAWSELSLPTRYTPASDGSKPAGVSRRKNNTCGGTASSGATCAARIRMCSPR
ncbi:hypothetical protein DIPPA_28272 [Diplonema papillatum]|nr:hypothetical protein DIPPA_28272 [Diplonema papillatum]